MQCNILAFTKYEKVVCLPGVNKNVIKEQLKGQLCHYIEGMYIKHL